MFIRPTTNQDRIAQNVVEGTTLRTMIKIIKYEQILANGGKIGYAN